MQSEIREQCVYVSGEVSVRTMQTQAYQQFMQQCRLPDMKSIDFSGVSRADSACIALILSALRCKGQGSLQCFGLPDSARSLAQLYEVEEWIND